MLADTLKWTWRAKSRLLSLSILLISLSIKFHKVCFIEIKCQKRLFSSFWPEYLRSTLKVVRFDQSGYFGRSDQNVPFDLAKLLSPVLLFCILLTITVYTKQCAVAWVGSVQQECRWSIWRMEFLKFQTKFLLNGKHPLYTIMYRSRPI